MYRQRSPHVASRVFVDQIPDDDLSELLPVEGATATVYFGGDYAKEPIDVSTPWKESGVTDPAGRFSAGSTCAPSKFHAAVVVEKPGFQRVIQVFLHDKSNHTIIAILAPEQGPQSTSIRSAPPN